jgi:hypothetical protein
MFVQKVPRMTVWYATSHADACGMADSFDYNLHIAVHSKQLWLRFVVLHPFALWHSFGFIALWYGVPEGVKSLCEILYETGQNNCGNP